MHNGCKQLLKFQIYPYSRQEAERRASQPGKSKLSFHKERVNLEPFHWISGYNIDQNSVTFLSLAGHGAGK